jgi:hypothetical protein
LKKRNLELKLFERESEKKLREREDASQLVMGLSACQRNSQREIEGKDKVFFSVKSNKVHSFFYFLQKIMMTPHKRHPV